jgi:hypothetical protein
MRRHRRGARRRRIDARRRYAGSAAPGPGRAPCRAPGCPGRRPGGGAPTKPPSAGLTDSVDTVRSTLSKIIFRRTCRCSSWPMQVLRAPGATTWDLSAVPPLGNVVDAHGWPSHRHHTLPALEPVQVPDWISVSDLAPPDEFWPRWLPWTQAPPAGVQRPSAGAGAQARSRSASGLRPAVRLCAPQSNVTSRKEMPGSHRPGDDPLPSTRAHAGQWWRLRERDSVVTRPDHLGFMRL